MKSTWHRNARSPKTSKANLTTNLEAKTLSHPWSSYESSTRRYSSRVHRNTAVEVPVQLRDTGRVGVIREVCSLTNWVINWWSWSFDWVRETVPKKCWVRITVLRECMQKKPSIDILYTGYNWRIHCWTVGCTLFCRAVGRLYPGHEPPFSARVGESGSRIPDWHPRTKVRNSLCPWIPTWSLLPLLPPELKKEVRTQ